MKIGNISGDGQPRKSLSRGPVAYVRRDAANDLYSLSLGRVRNGPTANAIYCHSINQVSVPPLLPSTDVAGKETKGIRSNCGKSKPSDLRSDDERSAHWEQWYQGLWKLKLS